MKVQEIMTTGVRCIGPDNNLVEAAAVMRELDIGSVLVCDNDHLTGVLTDRDIAVRSVADGHDPKRMPVRGAMSTGVICVYDDQEVDEAVRLFEQNQVRRLPVVSREHRLVGIVSLGDVAMKTSFGLSGEVLKEVSQPAPSSPRFL